jgi:hypothetical protein
MNKYVIPNCSTAAEKSVAKQINNAIYNYMADYSYDITGAADSAIDDYRSLSDTEKKELRNLILQYVSLSDLLVLQENYFPGLM